jgi:predicted outer membrane protein
MTLGAVALSATVAVAQTAADPQRREQSQQQDSREQREQVGVQSRGQQGANVKDSALATCLAIGNMAEIQVAEGAVPLLRDAQAKQFAQQMITDHRATLEKLQQFDVQLPASRAGSAGQGAASRTGTDPATRTRAQTDDAGRTAQAQPGQAGQAASARQVGQEARAGGSPGPDDFLALKHEVAQACVDMSVRALREAEKPDQAFIGAQIVAHQNMLAELQVFGRHASPQLSDLIAQATQTTEQHLQHAKQLMQQLDGQSQTARGTQGGANTPGGADTQR